MATYHLRVKNDTKSGGGKVSAKRHADYIFREEGQAHADYINREGAQSDRIDCIFKGSQLPKWANHMPFNSSLILAMTTSKWKRIGN